MGWRACKWQTRPDSSSVSIPLGIIRGQVPFASVSEIVAVDRSRELEARLECNGYDDYRVVGLAGLRYSSQPCRSRASTRVASLREKREKAVTSTGDCADEAEGEGTEDRAASKR